MSGFISKKYVDDQEFQEGQLPDDESYQPVKQSQTIPSNYIEDKKSEPEEEQFIFETVPVEEFQSDYKQKEKSAYRASDYQGKGYSSYKKEWQRGDRQRIAEKPSFHSQKKQSANIEGKRKNQLDEIRTPTPQIPGTISYYPNIPASNNPYITPSSVPPPPYYGGYPILPMPGQPSAGTRTPYNVFPPLQHQAPPGSLYTQTPTPYQIPNPSLYPHINPLNAYGAPLNLPMGQNIFVNDPYRVDSRPKYEEKQFIEEKPTQTYRQTNTPKSYPNRQQSRVNEFKISNQRQRSRDRKQRQFERKQKYDSVEKANQKAMKTLKKQKQEEKNKMKHNLSKKISEVFQTPQQKEEFLLMLRDIMKYIAFNKEKQSSTSRKLSNGIQGQSSIYQQNQEIIQNNYQKSLMKLQKIFNQYEKPLITNHTQKPSINSLLQKKQALLQILSLLDMGDVLIIIKENKLRKKLLVEKKASEIKKLLDQLVKDPRRKIK